jgi:hypothetical protein
MLFLHFQQNGPIDPVVLGDEPLLVGRSAGCDIEVIDKMLSGKHCRFEPRADGIYVLDLGSSNGTWVGGERIESAVKLSPGDEIKIGGTLIFLRDDGESATTGEAAGATAAASAAPAAAATAASTPAADGAGLRFADDSIVGNPAAPGVPGHAAGAVVSAAAPGAGIDAAAVQRIRAAVERVPTSVGLASNHGAGPLLLLGMAASLIVGLAAVVGGALMIESALIPGVASLIAGVFVLVGGPLLVRALGGTAEAVFRVRDALNIVVRELDARK